MIKKIGLYFLSLWLLFILIIIITIDIPLYFGEDWEFVGMKYLLSHNIISICCIICLIIGGIAYYDFNHTISGTPELPVEIIKIDDINYESLTFLITYIVPLVCFNFENIRQCLVLTVLLCAIGVIYIKTDLFYANPTLALLQFRIYKTTIKLRDGKTKDDIILICREKLSLHSYIKYIKLDEHIYYAKQSDT